MTLVAGYVGLEGLVMISDSRVTYETPTGQRFYCDVAQKLFPLNPYVAVGYASEDIKVTWKVIEGIASELRHLGGFRNLYALKDRLIGVSKKVSSRVYDALPKKPRTYLLFGILQPNRPRWMAKRDFFEFLKRTQTGAIPEQMLRGIQQANGPKQTHFNTGYPSSLVVAVALPEAKVRYRESIGGLAIGSGGFVEDTMTVDSLMHAEVKSGMGLRMVTVALLVSFRGEVEKHDERTVGGMYQVLTITSSGAMLNPYSMGEPTGDERTPRFVMQPTPTGWLQQDLKTGKSQAVLPPPLFPKPAHLHDATFDLKAFPWEPLDP